MAAEHADGSFLYAVGAASGVCGSAASILMAKLSGRQVVATMISAIFLGSMTGPGVLYLRPETPLMIAGGAGFFAGFLSLFLVPAGMKFGEKLTAKLFGKVGERFGLPADEPVPPAKPEEPKK